MNSIIKSASFALTFIAVSFNLPAQITPPSSLRSSEDNREEKIIIIKKGNSTEKLNIIVDGEKITVNGKPVDEFKNDHVQIMSSSDDDFREPLAPMPPMMQEKGQMLRNYMNNLSGNKAFLGVMTEATKEGAKITDVTRESPAEKSGLKEGDVITKINNEVINGPDDLYKAVGKYKADDKITITYKRNDKENTATATLTKNKEMRVYGFNQNKDFDFKMMPPSAPDAPYFFNWNDKPRLGVQAQDTEEGNGVKVLEVEDDSPAEKAGVKEGDIITQVNGKTITSVEELRDRAKDAKDGDTLKLTLRRNNQTQTVDVKFPKDLKTIDL